MKGVDLSECIEKIMEAYPDYVDLSTISTSSHLKALVGQLAELQVLVI